MLHKNDHAYHHNKFASQSEGAETAPFVLPRELIATSFDRI
jgi:hypothetical protein